MASAFQAHRRDLPPTSDEVQHTKKRLELAQRLSFGSLSSPVTAATAKSLQETSHLSYFSNNSTEHGLEFSVSGPSRVGKKTHTPRRRPHVRKRQQRKPDTTGALQVLYGPQESAATVGSKRKGSSEEVEASSAVKKKETRVIPREGSPKHQ